MEIKLADYPRFIADKQGQILRLDQNLRTLRENVAFCLSAIDRAIAFDGALKNDSQRKAKRAELMESDPDYIKVLTELRKVEDIRAEMDIELQLLRNEFSLLKLERREAIAQIELQAKYAA